MIFPSFRREFISEVLGKVVDNMDDAERLYGILICSLDNIISEYGYAIIGNMVCLKHRSTIYASPDYEDYSNDRDYTKILHNTLNNWNRKVKYILEGFDQCILTKDIFYDIVKLYFKYNDNSIVILN